MSPQKAQKRQEIVNYFRSVAAEDNQKNQKIEFGDLLDKKDKKRILFIIPESLGDIFLCTALFKSIRERYPRPEWVFYIATKPEYKEILDGNPFLDKWLQYQPIFDNHVWLTGNSQTNGYFNVAYHPYWATQRSFTYYSNGEDIIGPDLSSS